MEQQFAEGQQIPELTVGKGPAGVQSHVMQREGEVWTRRLNAQQYQLSQTPSHGKGFQE